MDIAGFVERHEAQWRRLRELASSRRLTGDEADELVALYQRTSTHLAVVRGSAYDPELEARLTSLLTSARAAITGSGTSMLTGVARFFGSTLPSAFYRLRWWTLAVAIGCLGVSVWVCLACLRDPALLHLYFSDHEIDYIVNHAFSGYYSAQPSADFALNVWLNNTKVSATCALLGVLVYPALVTLWSNFSWIGHLAALLFSRGKGVHFFEMLLPHGLLELTCIFFAGAAGLRMAAAWIAPGAEPRSRTLAREGRAMGAIIVGLAVALGISGLLEGYVTPAGWLPSMRLAVGFVTWAAFLAYVLVLGRRAHLAGESDDVTGAGATALDPIESAV